MRISTSMRWLVVAVSAAMLLAVAAACSSETIEVPGETVVVEKEVIKEIQVPGETVVVEKEVIKEVMVPGETVVKEVVKEVEVPGETVVVKEEVVKTVEVPGETVVVEKVVVKEVPAGYVTDPSTGRAVSAPQYGGTLNLAAIIAWDREHADPMTETGAYRLLRPINQDLGRGDWAIDRDVLSYSFVEPAADQMVGALAESWELSPDGLTYTFHIRKGVRFHDKPPVNGREMTANDILFGWQRYLGLGEFTEDGPTQFIGQMARPLESIAAPDKYTFVVKVKQPELGILLTLLKPHPNPYLHPLAPEVLKEFDDLQEQESHIGTGAFMWTDWARGTSLTYIKHPDYYGYDDKYPENRLPYVDGFKVLFIGELETRMAAMRTGKIDMIDSGFSSFNNWTMEVAEDLQKTNPEVVVWPAVIRSNFALAVNTQKPPFDDISVRRAMQMALDLPTIVATYFKGYADATPQGITGANNIGYMVPFEEWPEEIKGYYTYNPEGAEALLDAAEYPRGADGIRLKTKLTNNTKLTDYMLICLDYWKAIGVDVEGVGTATYAEYRKPRDDRTYEGMIRYHSGFQGNRNAVKVNYYSTSINPSNVQDPVFDAMIDALNAATTYEEERKLTREADMYGIEQHWTIWGPMAMSANANQPWIIGFNGEDSYQIGVYARIWIDHELAAAMGR